MTEEYTGWDAYAAWYLKELTCCVPNPDGRSGCNAKINGMYEMAYHIYVSHSAYDIAITLASYINAEEPDEEDQVYKI